MFALKRLLAVDLGARYCGLALRRTWLGGAQPYGLVERQLPKQRQGHFGKVLIGNKSSWLFRSPEGATSFATQAAALEAAIRLTRADGVVMGMPYHKDGSASPESRATADTVKRLRAAWKRDVPVIIWDETWTTRFVVGPTPKLGKRNAAWTHSAALACLAHSGFCFMSCPGGPCLPYT